MKDITDLVQNLNDQLAAYNNKPTKACSARIRLLLGKIKKDTPATRSKLVALDKAGY